MVNYLKDVSVDTFIAELPSIIGYNNRAINREFDSIYDSSSNRLVKGVYAPTSDVTAHWGKFINLTCDYIDVTDVSSFSKLMSNIPHNMLAKRFVNDNIKSDGTIDYCHDLMSIASGLSDGESLASRLARLDTSMRRIYQHLAIKPASQYKDSATWKSEEESAVNIANSSYFYAQQKAEDIAKIAYWERGPETNVNIDYVSRDLEDATLTETTSLVDSSTARATSIISEHEHTSEEIPEGMLQLFSASRSAGNVKSNEDTNFVDTFKGEITEAVELKEHFNLPTTKLRSKAKEISGDKKLSANILTLLKERKNNKVVNVDGYEYIKITNDLPYIFTDKYTYGKIINVLFYKSAEMNKPCYEIILNNKEKMKIDTDMNPRLMRLKLIAVNQIKTGDAAGSINWELYDTNIPLNKISIM